MKKYLGLFLILLLCLVSPVYGQIGDGIVGGEPRATETVAGIAELATTTEATTGTNDDTIMTPLDVSAAIAAISGIGSAEVYSSGWNTDTSTPQKNDIYDYLHLLDTNDDGDIDTVDAARFMSPGEIGGTAANKATFTDLYLYGADVTHGMTSIAATNDYIAAFQIGASGGLDLYGLTEANQAGAFRATGIIGATDPTDSYPAVVIRGGKKNGTGWQALGDAETVAMFYNYTTPIGTLYGNGEWILPSLQNTPIGSTTASSGAFTTLSASSTVSGTGFSTYLASPPTIGGTTPTAVYSVLQVTSHGATEAVAAATLYGNVHKITGAYVVTLPAAVVGMSASFRASTAAVFSVDTNGADHFETYDGTVLDAGDKLTSSGVKNEWIDIYCESANTWIVRRQSGVIIDGGA